jgi:hypothetical protein
MNKPRFITREELDERLRKEELVLTGDDRAWWNQHRVEPFVVSDGDQVHFAVAVNGIHAVIFFDDEDEFGSATLGPSAAFEGMGLYGDLADAVRGLRYHD